MWAGQGERGSMDPAGKTSFFATLWGQTLVQDHTSPLSAQLTPSSLSFLQPLPRASTLPATLKERAEVRV